MKWFDFLLLLNSIILFLIVVGVLFSIVRLDLPLNISKSDYRVFFSDDVLAHLNENFLSGLEHKVCLDGYFVGNHSFVLDRIVSENVGEHDKVYGLCFSLAEVHNHNKDFGLLSACKPSVADVNSWKLEADGGVLIFFDSVWC